MNILEAIEYLEGNKSNLDETTNKAVEVILSQVKKHVKINQDFVDERNSRAKEAINAIFNVTGVDVISTRKSRKPDYVFARNVFCDIMRSNYNYTYFEIGDFIDKNHTSVIFSIKTSLPSFLTEKKYNRMYNEIKQIL